MAKSKTKFCCTSCGYESPKWMGRCPGCQEWNTFEEEMVASKKETKRSATTGPSKKPQSITKVSSSEHSRYDTKIEELNRVLGGGIVKGSLCLISGEPGIGKSTLILQCSSNMAKHYGKVLYVSGEESEEQIRMRAERLDAMAEDLLIVSETNIGVVEEYINTYEPKFLIVDSIQTLYREELSAAPGSVSQVKECVNNLMRIAKTTNIPIFIVAHVTKQGELAGPRVLEHMVDAVLHFEGERTMEFRILRALKNRFGTTSEIGVFEMREEGLIEIFNPSELFLETLNEKNEGAIVVSTVEGTRPLLVEIQALVTENNIGFARRTAVGIDYNRLNLIIAVLEKKLGLPLANYDVYVNVVGGLKLEGTSYDLGVALSIYSSFKGVELPSRKVMVIGEISLTGEIRPVAQAERMIKEGMKMGFESVMISNRNKKKLTQYQNTENLLGVDTLREAVQEIIR